MTLSTETSEVFTTNTQSHIINCNYTGIPVASVNVLKVAGHIPYLAQWKETQAYHPLFSLSHSALLNYSKSLWAHICSLSAEDSVGPKAEKSETLLRVATLALLHHLADVEQTTVWMPSLQAVSTNWKSLLELSYWKLNLESVRFKFPKLRISKFNNGISLSAFIEDCWACKKEYDSHKKTLSEEAAAKAAEDALLSIRGEIAGKAPKSKRMLWKWFVAHMPSRYSKDLDGWMFEIWDAETESEISEFTMADIDLFEEIFLCEVPTGSSISHAFLERISNKRKVLENKFHTFEILVPESIAEQKEAGTIATEEPKLADFPSKVQFIIAHAKWKLAHTDLNKHRDLEITRQQTRTVTASHIPDITEFLTSREEATADTDTEDLGIDTSSAHDNDVTGTFEE